MAARKYFEIMILLAFVHIAASGASNAESESWVDLFDGKTLQGWIPKIRGFPAGVNYGNTFRVEDGLLKVSYDQYQDFSNRFGHLFYQDKFSYYRLVLEYRFVGEQVRDGPSWAFRNSGVMLHSQSPYTMKLEQDFPISIEVQLLGGNGKDKRPTANLCTPGTHVVLEGKLFTPHCLSSSSETYHGDQWVHVEIEVLGHESIRHLVGGRTVLAYEKPQIGGGAVSEFDPAIKQDGTLLSEGYLALQSESHPVEFRKVALLNLVGCMDRRAKNFRSYYRKADPKQCRY
ncbi:MAG: DUF1080 domain-containing protein [Bryobacteraceae bacterium]|nr:DUF1080 domain-containing protein [Bryobacteraceae bacterium]MDW8377688.1 DUF1080 domain-containing protein [Bryobacterales bacterium]